MAELPADLITSGMLLSGMLFLLTEWGWLMKTNNTFRALILIFTVVGAAQGQSLERKVLWGEIAYIAHRGESGSAPENTLAAFRLAWELNADAVELDIHLSKDNRIVVIHDANTKRTSGQDFIVKNTDSELLRELDVGSFKDSFFKGERIPFLEEAIALIPPEKKLIIELKSGTDVLPFLQTIVIESGRIGQLVFIAFDWQTIVDAKHMFPHNPCYWLSSNKIEINTKISEAAAAGLDGLDLHFSAIDENLINRARQLKLDVMAWTVDNPEEAKRLIALGVKGITTNRTTFLRSQIAEK